MLTARSALVWKHVVVYSIHLVRSRALVSHAAHAMRQHFVCWALTVKQISVSVEVYDCCQRMCLTIECVQIN